MREKLLQASEPVWYIRPVLVIRREQMNALLAHRRLVRAVDHARKCFPEQCAKLTADELRRTARSALSRAGAYGMTSMRDALQFLDLMLVLGADFDERLPWAREILEEQTGRGARLKSTRLYMSAMRHLRSHK